MKQVKYLLFLVAVFTLAACNSEDLSYNIERTAIHPIGGQYTIKISKDGKEVLQTKCYIANTVTNDGDKCWIRVGELTEKKVHNINGKIDCNPGTLSFSGTNIENLAGNVLSSSDKFSITNGKLELNGVETPSGTMADKISFSFTTTKDPGATYTVEGWRFTAWGEDDPQ